MLVSKEVVNKFLRSSDNLDFVLADADYMRTKGKAEGRLWTTVQVFEELTNQFQQNNPDPHLAYISECIKKAYSITAWNVSYKIFSFDLPKIFAEMNLWLQGIEEPNEQQKEIIKAGYFLLLILQQDAALLLGKENLEQLITNCKDAFTRKKLAENQGPAPVEANVPPAAPPSIEQVIELQNELNLDQELARCNQEIAAIEKLNKVHQDLQNWEYNFSAFWEDVDRERFKELLSLLQITPKEQVSWLAEFDVQKGSRFSFSYWSQQILGPLGFQNITWDNLNNKLIPIIDTEYAKMVQQTKSLHSPNDSAENLVNSMAPAESEKSPGEKLSAVMSYYGHVKEELEKTIADKAELDRQAEELRAEKLLDFAYGKLDTRNMLESRKTVVVNELINGWRNFLANRSAILYCFSSNYRTLCQRITGFLNACSTPQGSLNANIDNELGKLDSFLSGANPHLGKSEFSKQFQLHKGILAQVDTINKTQETVDGMQPTAPMQVH